MLLSVTIILGIALIYMGLRLRGHHRALDRLRQSIANRQPFLQNDLPGASGKAWDDLCRTSNEVLEELDQVRHTQTGQLSQLEATLGGLQEAVLVVDDRNHIILANNAFQNIFPKAVSIIDQRLEVVLHSAAFLKYLKSVRAGHAAPQFPLKFVEGAETRWVEVTGSTIPPLDDRGGQWVLFVIHDITRQKELELVRKEFVANVSHELRTPLSVIMGYVETLVEDHQDMEKNDLSRFLDTIQRHAIRLNSLLTDLLTLSRLESINPGLHHESIALGPFIQGIVDDYQSQPAAANHHLSCEMDPAIGKLLLDPLKITQVFANLIDNSIKYTPAGSTISITTKLGAAAVQIQFSDDGPGIPTDDLPHIFERFYRVEKGRSREKGGTGLGLSIVKHIIKLHGGKIRAKSPPGQGTTFVMSLSTKSPRGAHLPLK